MKAIILAVGKATRLLPLTKNTPQSLLKIGNKTILEMQIERLQKAGIDDITVITGYLSDTLEKFCKKIKVKTLLNPFYDVSGKALTIWIVKDILKDGFLFMYSDVLFDSKVIKELLNKKGEACLIIKKNGLRDEAEKVIESRGEIKKITKDTLSTENGEFIGIGKFSSKGSKKLIDALNDAAKKDINTSLLTVMNNLIKKGTKIKAYDMGNAQFFDIDFPEDLEEAKKRFK